MKFPRSAAQVVMLLSFSALTVRCTVDGTTISNESHLGTTTLGSPASAAMTSISKDDRDADEAAIIAFQQSDEWQQSGRRCGTAQEPTFDEAARDASDCSFSSTTIRDEYAAANGTEFVIPVVFHVIVKSDGTTGNVPMSELTAQIQVLNQDYNAVAGSPGAPGNKAKMRFVLADKKPDGSPTNGVEYIQNDSYFNDPGSGLSPMKAALSWDATRYFNVYSNDAGGGGILGYATFPSQSAGTTEDGVVVNWEFFPGSPTAGIYNLGRTLTHEAGHYFGLFHTFQGAACAASSFNNGDLIQETPPEKAPTFNCPSGAAAQSCTGIAASITNYMNYTQDNCMNKFSEQQVNRIRCSILAYRPGFAASAPPPPPPGNNAPAAAFASGVSTLTVSFQDHSTDSDGNVTSWAWNFGDATTSSEQSPTHTYVEAGTYAVTLTVTDNAGASATTTSSVTVSGGASDSELQNGKAVTGLAGAAADELYFTFNVAPNAKDLRIALANGTGDADLFVRFGDRPSASTFDYRTKTKGNTDAVLPTTASAGTWYIMVRGYRAFSGVSLTASYTAGAPNAGGSTTVSDSHTGTVQGRQALRYEITVAAGRIDASLAWAGAFDLDLLLTDVNDKSIASATSATANPETLSVTVTAGTYRLYVYNYTTTDALAAYTLSASWQK